MDAFRRRSTPFLHSSLVIEILELPRSFHGGIVDESSVPNLYRGNRSNSFFTKYGIQRKGKEKFSSIFFSWKIPFLPPSLPRKEKHTEQLLLPLAIILSRKFHRLKHAPWSSSSLVISSSLSSFPFISFRKKKERRKGKRSKCNDGRNLKLASHGANSRGRRNASERAESFIGLSGSNYAVVISAPSSTANNTFPRKLFSF